MGLTQVSYSMINGAFANVLDFGAVADGITDDSAAIQAAIDHVAAANGGTVYFPTGIYSIGTTGIVSATSVNLVGENASYRAVSPTAGVILKYSGTTTAILLADVKRSNIENIAIDMSGTSTVNVKALYLNGVWQSTFKNVSVYGFQVDAYSIYVDQGAGGVWTSQHLYFENCETADGFFAFIGYASNNAITTCVVNTNRGMAYVVDNATVTFINATAEKWPSTTNAFTFTNFGRNLMLGCDIESGDVGANIGIYIDSNSQVWEYGTNWAGFTGTTRIQGKTQPHTDYSGTTQNVLYGLVNGQTFPGMTFGQVPGSGVGDFVTYTAVANDVAGGAQDGYPLITRRLGGSVVDAWQFNRGLRLEREISFTGATATEYVSIAIPSAYGNVRVRASASGFQAAAGGVSSSVECVATNTLGTITTSVSTPLTIGGGGATATWTFTPSGNDLLCKFNTGGAGSNSAKIVVEIDGDFSSYS